ncbi:hypothetical protein DB30_06110 [Enhygromyxa salina]|uniref:Glycosyl transferase family 28 C-terminal domain-containing protein n=1 Tax=Enhygromyxa salina TaxID=215803 RepID=A0A0C1ZVJ0_9BACT|nr:glycosyltransferase [Enhygromyxa salina]KIG15078.1 hypothetical protein DB30_06110 [Enhygromyxa salina]
MELPRTLSIVSYAVNGRGLGHLSRQVAIHRWLRRYATFAGIRSQHWFLTTSEADTLLFHEGFAGFKLPSKSVVAEAGISKPSYLALAKQWIWHSVALLRPDLFVVDTFPGGSFQELLGVLDLCKHPALVLRPVRPEFAGRPSFRALAGLYERVIVPSDAASEPGLAAALGLASDRLRFVGPIMRGEAFERLDRSQARARLGIPAQARCVLVSGGGGGDDDVARLFEAVEASARTLEAESASAPPLWLVFAAGPLFRGRPLTGSRRIWWTTPDLPPLLSAFDAAICAGGFNAVHELSFAGVPTAFVPQRKIADDQHDRVRGFVEAGAALCVELSPQPRADPQLLAALRELLDPNRGPALATQARARVPTNNARAAASELLGLCLPAAILDHAKDALDEALLTELGASGVSLADLVQLSVDLQDPRTPVDRSELALAPTLDLLAETRELGVPLPQLSRLAKLMARRIKSEAINPELLGELLLTVLRAPASAGQWSALTMVLDALPGDRSLDAPAFVARLLRLLDTAAHTGHDLLALARVILEQPPGLAGERLYAGLHSQLRAPPTGPGEGAPP